MFESSAHGASGDATGRAAEAARDANDSELPVFIVGMPRSGTTLAEQILASHPAVFGAGEPTFWMEAAAAYAREVNGGGSARALLPTLAAGYLRLLRGLSADALRVVDKLPANFMNLGLMCAALPNARIIHMHRHPIDTCLSVYFQNFPRGHTYANDLEDLAHHYREYRRVMAHWRRVLPAGAILDVPYEGLVEDPEAWSRTMLNFIGLPWNPRCLDFEQTRRIVLTLSKWQVRQKISKASAGRWRRYEKFLGPLRDLEAGAPVVG
jgi:hypothetical protein